MFKLLFHETIRAEPKKLPKWQNVAQPANTRWAKVSLRSTRLNKRINVGGGVCKPLEN